jgi:predicted nucleotidyltransferase
MSSYGEVNDTWTVVKSKKRGSERRDENENSTKITIDYVRDNLKFLKQYNPRSVFVYGSVAKGTNRPSSDIDILIIWEKKIPKNIAKIKNDIEIFFKRKVDFVSLFYKGKITFDCDENNISQPESFLSNIITECIPIFGDKCDIILSEYIGKN